MKVTKAKLKQIIKEEVARTDESSFHSANNNWEQDAARLVGGLIMTGIESTLNIQLSKEDSYEYAEDIMSAIERSGDTQFIEDVNDIYREIEARENERNIAEYP